MRVVQMLDTLYWGGAQKMQLFLVESLVPLGVEVTVISLSANANSPVPALLEAAGARVVTFPFPKLFSPGAFFKLVAFLRAEKFDLLHAYLTYSNIIGPLAGLLSGTPAIASLRNADFEKRGYTPWRMFLETFSMRHWANRIMANGQVVAQFARQRLKDQRPVEIIPNAVDLVSPLPAPERESLRRELIGDPERLVVLSVGRLTAAKGFEDLLAAFALVHAEHPQAVLVIAGGGDLLPGFQAQIASLGLQEQVFMLGRRNDVPRLLAAADVYVNSSHWEGTPVSVLEAMAAGLPVTATTVGENPYLLAEGVGLLVPPHQPAALASALNSLLASSARRAELGQAALNRVSQVYSRETWRRSLLELYTELTPQAAPYLAQITASELQLVKN
jgi:glycosyltransferase involved in cell wall biosynthesis